MQAGWLIDAVAFDAYHAELAEAVVRNGFFGLLGALTINRGTLIKCKSCDGCEARSIEIRRTRYLAVAWILAWLFFSPMLFAVIGQLTDKESPAALLIIPISILLFIAGFFAGPLFVRRYLSRKIPELLGPVQNPRLMKYMHLANWGFTDVLFSRSGPAGATAISIDELASDGKSQ